MTTLHVRPLWTVILAVACSLMALTAAVGQTAPEGNAHPKSQDISETGPAEAVFGPTTMIRSSTTGESKLAFSQAVDLEPLRDLAVFHNGRTKILDTLARETVGKLMGTKKYADYIPKKDEPGRFDKVRYDQLFTWFDLMIDPGYYVDKPLLAVDYLPLRRAFIELEYPGDENLQERALKLIQVKPIVFATHAQTVQQAHMSEPAYLQALDQVYNTLTLWEKSPSNLVLVAPDEKDLPWKHLGELAADHPARRAAADLGAAWRALDAPKATAAAASLAAEIKKINAPMYPTAKRSLELTYNRSNAFEWGFWGYFLSLVALILAFGTGRSTLAWIGSGLLIASVAMHGFGFISRCLIAERFAIQNQFESMTGVSLFAALVGLGIMLAKRQWLYGAAAAGVGFLVLITATQTNIPGKFIEREAAILNTSILLKYHVTTVLVSYGLIALGFIISLFYLGTHYFGREGASMAEVAVGEAGPAGRARTLADLDTAQMTVLQLAFWTLGVGILLGAWWADHSWGRWWAFDPKETWALITWIVYLIAIHVRFAAIRNKGLTTAWLSLAGFIVMLFTYFGVNLLLPGLHAYA